MHSKKDIELVNKAADAASFLRSDLQTLVSADEPLLSEAATDLLQQAASLHNKLERLRNLFTGRAA